MSVRCNLCNGSGDNKTGIILRINNHICPRCGGYGTIPDGCADDNPPEVTESDQDYMRGNGIVGREKDARADRL